MRRIEACAASVGERRPSAACFAWRCGQSAATQVVCLRPHERNIKHNPEPHQRLIQTCCSASDGDTIPHRRQWQNAGTMHCCGTPHTRTCAESARNCLSGHTHRAARSRRRCHYDGSLVAREHPLGATCRGTAVLSCRLALTHSFPRKISHSAAKTTHSRLDGLDWNCLVQALRHCRSGEKRHRNLHLSARRCDVFQRQG